MNTGPSSLDSPAVGSDLALAPCRDPLRPATPSPPPVAPTLGLTFSGGGFRATFAALGVIRYLADVALLDHVRYVSSVSGGSIANGLLSIHWPALRAERYSTQTVDELLIDPAVGRVSKHSLKRSLLVNAWRIIGPRNRTDLLGDQMDKWFFNRTRLDALDPEVRWIFNAANITTGVRFGFERDVVGDYVSGLMPTAGSRLRVAQAAAASAAVPGAFAAWELKGLTFPCAPSPPKLLDGGVYDNTGLEALDHDRYSEVFTVTINAGGLLRPGVYGRIPIVRDLSRANSLLYRQSTALRTRTMVAAFRRGAQSPMPAPLPDGARRGVLVGLGTDFPNASDELAAWRTAFPETRTWRGTDLALYPTVFDRLPEELCRRLVYRGWWLTGAAFATYYPDAVPKPAGLLPPKYE